MQLLKHFPTVVYISCNPNTLVANLREVKDTHEIRYLAGVCIAYKKCCIDDCACTQAAILYEVVGRKTS